MSDALGLLALNTMFLVAGLGLVRALGLPLRGRWLPSALGIAPAAGVLACSIAAAELATVGIPIGIPTVVITATCLVVWGAFTARRQHGRLIPSSQPQSRLGRGAEVGLLCLLGFQ